MENYFLSEEFLKEELSNTYEFVTDIFDQKMIDLNLL